MDINNIINVKSKFGIIRIVISYSNTIFIKFNRLNNFKSILFFIKLLYVKISYKVLYLLKLENTMQCILV